jgi:hypothetical protein
MRFSFTNPFSKNNFLLNKRDIELFLKINNLQKDMSIQCIVDRKFYSFTRSKKRSFISKVIVKVLYIYIGNFKYKVHCTTFDSCFN